MADEPLSERSVEIFCEAIIAAILATATGPPASQDGVIKAYKDMLQRLRSEGGAFK